MHLTFRIDSSWGEVDTSSRILTEYHFYVNDDETHDNLFVQHCFKLHWEFLGVQGHLVPIEHIVFSNGCTSQLKCAKVLFFVVRYPSLTKSEDLPMGCFMQWNHFGSGHGKGHWDGVGVHVKQAL